MPPDPVIARPAATILLLREDDGLEVLMVTRSARGFFGGLTAFPGGGVEPSDDSELARAVVRGSSDDHVYRVAALRELAEETGIALTTSGPEVAPEGKGMTLLTTLSRSGVVLDGEAPVMISRWVTPDFAPKRFDTMFFLADGSGSPEVRLDGDELVDHMWVRPGRALDLQSEDRLQMFTPTIAHLRWLALRSHLDEALDSARGSDGRSMVEPVVMEDGSIVPVLLPGDRR
ncbi:MAG: NUDIX domain-containing protein [Acidimicrobiia bacterium]